MRLFAKSSVLFALVLFSVMGLISVSQAGAINPQEQFQQSLKDAQVIDRSARPVSPEAVVGSAINTVLTYIGVAILALIIYAGILWATARGNDQQIAKSKQILLGAIIGLIIIFTAAGVVNFVIRRLGQSLTDASSRASEPTMHQLVTENSSFILG